MFEKNFTLRQKGVFLNLINEVILADKKITEAEREKMQFFADIFPGVTPEKCKLCDLKEIFTSKQARASAMLELISVGMVDGKMGPDEASLLHEIALNLEISDGTFEEMKDWVNRMLLLVKESQAFMER